MLTQIPTRLGSPHSMAQNPHSAIIHLGHANGTMTLWSPNMTTPHVKLLAHRGPVNGIAVDPSEHSAGRYVATSGMDGTVKLWDGRMWGKEVREWKARNQITSLAFSGMGMLSVGGKSGVTVYQDLYQNTHRPPSPYLTLPLPSLTASATRFCPFDDLLCVGHERGISSLIVPGSGEPNFDSAEADLFETRTRRREREVRGVLEKIRPELITMDANFLGKISEGRGGETHEEREGRSFRQLGRLERLRLTGKADEPEQEAVDDEDAGLGDGEADPNGGERSIREKKERRKMKGKGGSTKRYLRKKAKKNIVDNSLVSLRKLFGVIISPTTDNLWIVANEGQGSGATSIRGEEEKGRKGRDRRRDWGIGEIRLDMGFYCSMRGGLVCLRVLHVYCISDAAFTSLK